jgi:hypothetical protein
MWRSLSRQIAGLDEPRQPDDQAFALMLDRLEVFVGERGRIPNRGSKEPEEARLGAWIEAQRRAEHGGLLCPERRALLEEHLGSGWSSRS